MVTKLLTQASFTHRLVIATLTGQPLHISQIRSSSPTEPGLAPHEISFLRLLEAVTNGSTIEISYTGTTLYYKPGLITGSAAGLGSSSGVTKHELPPANTRGLSYFLIPLCMLAPFSKAPFSVLFTGPGVITSATGAGDVSVDTVRTAILPLYKHFGIENKLELRILKRSCADTDGKGGAGEVQLVFGHQVRLPKTLHFLNQGRVKKIRGVAYCVGVPPANNARMIEAARGILNPYIKDIYIFSDVSSAPQITTSKGKRRIGVGFGLSLVAETTTDVLYSADDVVRTEGGETPEDVGRRCAFQLLEDISRGGCVSTVGAPTMLLLMSMGSEDVGRLRMGRAVVANEETIRLGRELRKLGGNAWGLRDKGDDTDDVLVTVVGRGVGNVGRKIA